MKYEFVKIDEDTTELKYKDKVFPIKRDLDLQVKIQGSIKRARILMSKDLTSMGMSKKDLTIEKHEGNKTYYDNSNAMEIEQQYQIEAINEVYDEILKKYTNMSLAELMQDIGLDVSIDNEENKKFGLELTKAITGKTDNTPSKK